VLFDVVRVKELGRVVPRHLVGRLRVVRGEFHLADERVADLGRFSRLATLQVVGQGAQSLALYDAALMRADTTRLVLSGFEREWVDAQLVDFSQTWVMELASGDTAVATRGPPFPG